MSTTDLHLHRDLPKLRITAVKIDKAVPSPDEPTTPVLSVEEKVDENDVAVVTEESYRTPTSKESKIPAILSCPPAPKKPKAFVSCKRKLLEDFQFFEVTSNEDMDAFFRSTFPKRSCTCT